VLLKAGKAGFIRAVDYTDTAGKPDYSGGVCITVFH
jgi:hypothetical protein